MPGIGRKKKRANGGGAHRTTRGRTARGTREHRTSWTRAGHRRFRDNDIRYIEISKERKGEKKELGGVAPRVRPAGVGGSGVGGNAG